MGDRTLTYGEIDAEANRLASVLAAMGIAVGDRVLWWGETALEAVPLFAALAKLGAVFAPLNARYGVEEAMEVVDLARAQLLIADVAHLDSALEIADRPGSPGVACLDAVRCPLDRVIDLSEAPTDAVEQDPGPRDLDDRLPHVLFFTSGSTGSPKGVVLSHRANFLRSIVGNFSEPERVVCMFPLFHMAGWTLALGAWQGRGEIVFVDTATADTLLAAVERRRATRLYCIPAVWARILEADLSRWDLTSLREVDTGTSATPPELLEALKRSFPGTRTRIAYGSTEAGSGTRLDDDDVLRKPGSVGLPAPGVDLRFTDKGEVCLRSEFLMDGYFDNPEATREALSDGWYLTGDLGALDDEGYLFIVGRVRDVIRTGGETVGPGEVEEALAGHPGVADIAVIGLPDPRWGEIVCAVAVPRPGAALELTSLVEHCEGSLASYKRPRRLEIVDEVPRTSATGQVRRALLVERILARG